MDLSPGPLLQSCRGRTACSFYYTALMQQEYGVYQVGYGKQAEWAVQSVH